MAFSILSGLPAASPQSSRYGLADVTSEDYAAAREWIAEAHPDRTRL